MALGNSMSRSIVFTSSSRWPPCTWLGTRLLMREVWLKDLKGFAPTPWMPRRTKMVNAHAVTMRPMRIRVREIMAHMAGPFTSPVLQGS